VTCDVSQLWRHQAIRYMYYIELWSIHFCFHWCKSYKNRPRNARVIVENIVALFSGHCVAQQKVSISDSSRMLRLYSELLCDLQRHKNFDHSRWFKVIDFLPIESPYMICSLNSNTHCIREIHNHPILVSSSRLSCKMLRHLTTFK